MIQASLILGKADLPDGKVVGDFRVVVSLPGQDPVTQHSANSTFVIDVTAPGTYTISAARLTTDGTVVGGEVTTTYFTPTPVVPVQVDVPISIVLTLVP